MRGFTRVLLVAALLTGASSAAADDRRPVIDVVGEVSPREISYEVSQLRLGDPSAVVADRVIQSLRLRLPVFAFRNAASVSLGASSASARLRVNIVDDGAVPWPTPGNTVLAIVSLELPSGAQQAIQLSLSPNPTNEVPDGASLVAALGIVFQNWSFEAYFSSIPFVGANAHRDFSGLATSFARIDLGGVAWSPVFQVPFNNNVLKFKVCDQLWIKGPLTSNHALSCDSLRLSPAAWPNASTVPPTWPEIFLTEMGEK